MFNSVHPLDLWHDSGAAWLCLLRCLCPNQLDGLGTTTAISMGAKWLLFFMFVFGGIFWYRCFFELFFEAFFFLKCPLFHRSRFFWLYSFKICLVYPSFRWLRYPHHPNQQGFWVKHPWKRSNKSSHNSHGRWTVSTEWNILHWTTGLWCQFHYLLQWYSTQEYFGSTDSVIGVERRIIFKAEGVSQFKPQFKVSSTVAIRMALLLLCNIIHSERWYLREDTCSTNLHCNLGRSESLFYWTLGL